MKRALNLSILGLLGASYGCRLDHSLGDALAANDAGMETFVADASDADAANDAYARSSETGATETSLRETSLSQTSVALVWYPLGFESAGLSPIQSGCEANASVVSPYASSVVQNIDIPVASSIVLSDAMLPRPPQQALAPAPDGVAGSWGAAQLVIYRDLNRNGTLDTRAANEASVDEVLASSSEIQNQFYNDAIDESYVIYYADADIDSVGPAVKKGFNLFKDGHNSFGFMERFAVPLSTPIPMPVKQDVATRTLDCEYFCFSSSAYACPEHAADLPAEGSAKCYPAQNGFDASFAWRLDTCDNCECQSVECTYALADAQAAGYCVSVK